MLHAQSTTLPAARVDDLVTTETESEVLVYDSRDHSIHHLSPIAAAVWRLCTGERGLNDIVRQVRRDVDPGVSAEIVNDALGRLDQASLLAGPLPFATRQGTRSRRSVLRKAGSAGLASLPLVVSMTAPRAVEASSRCQTTTQPGGSCGTIICCPAGYACLWNGSANTCQRP